MKVRYGLPLAVALVVVLAGCSTPSSDAPTPTANADADEAAVTNLGRSGEVLTVAEERDGDSFVASDGVEYRVGLINTPELSECGGREAADRAYELLDGGFTADIYAEDVHGRQVARISVAEGDLGVILAAEGLAEDRFLEEFRHENPAYAAELEEAFAEARRGDAGLWGSCWEARSASSTGGGAQRGEHAGRTGLWACHPAYVECLPRGPDLDCRDVGHQVRLFGADDPFRLDGNNTTATDGVGCDTFEAWSPDAVYPYYERG